MKKNSPEQIIIRIAALFWIILKLMSYKLWMTDRLFPLLPVIEISVPDNLHALLYVVSLAALGAFLFRPSSSLMMCIVGVELFSCILDYTRWQPWEYQFLLMSAIFLLARSEEEKKSGYIFLFAALYFYSGIHKLNPEFNETIWTSMILGSFFHVPNGSGSETLTSIGYALGILEALGGLGLIWKRTAKVAVIFLILMHLFNLLVLGPLGINYNPIVWPWNVLMIVLLAYVFLRSKLSFEAGKFFNLRFAPIFILWGIMPMLCLWGYWDHYLSASLYSGKLPLMDICIETDYHPELAAYTSQDELGICKGKDKVTLRLWAMEELMVPPYPAPRVYKQAAVLIKEKYPDAKCYQYYLKSASRSE